MHKKNPMEGFTFTSTFPHLPEQSSDGFSTLHANETCGC
ncbi:MAG: hypothetical protein K0R54_828 [Clostridiaceae bacterium]|jgi:hypothetical protein|nr:hypothetical protein [Clostridiaceae bacterium]